MTYTSDISNQVALRQAFARYPSGLAALAARVEGEDHVFIVATFNVGISLIPPLVSFAVQHQSTTWPELRKAKHIGISILAADQSHLCRQLASKNKNHRWDGVEMEATHSGALFIKNNVLAFECAIYAEYPAGDHELILLEVKSFHSTIEREPLVFHDSRFRMLEADA